MKKRLLAMSLAAGFTVLLTACGDETTNTDIIKAEAFAQDSLPDCSKAYAGKFATVGGKTSQILICVEDAGSYDWMPISVSAQTSTDSSAKATGCTAKQLSDGAGAEIICNGKTVATLKNGQKGDQGEAGQPGDDGNPGNKGGDGDPGNPGLDFSLDSTYCNVMDYGYGTIIYDCDGRYYPVNMRNDIAASLMTWDKFYMTDTLWDIHENQLGVIKGVYLESANTSTTSGNIQRGGDDNSWNYTLTNFFEPIAASLTVSAGATPSAVAEVEPLVGVAVVFDYGYGVKSQNLAKGLGVCLSYTAENDMEVLVQNTAGRIARATLKAASGDTVANILATEFVPDSENVELGDIVNNVEAIYIKAVGAVKGESGYEAGEYENVFTIHQFGSYGKCAVPTIDVAAVKAAILESKGEATPDLVDDRSGSDIAYKTVKIGGRVWMAENLRNIDYTVDVSGDDYYHSYCPSTNDSLLAYGCFYTWSAAMDFKGLYKKDTEVANNCSQGTLCEAAQPVRGICPDGWHLPSRAEAAALLDIATSNGEYPQLAVAALSWLGFSESPYFYIEGLGYDFHNEYVYGDTEYHMTWLSENTNLEGDNNTNYAAYTINYDDGYASLSYPELVVYGIGSDDYAMPVRCVQDVEEA